jgi:hypothetical protein
MGIKRKIKHTIVGKHEKEKEIAFEVKGRPVVKKEDYVCNSDEEGYGPAKYLYCSRKGKIKTTVYTTYIYVPIDFGDISVRFTIYAYPIISEKKWTFYIHEGIEDGEDYNGIEDDMYFDTPEEAIKTAISKIYKMF